MSTQKKLVLKKRQASTWRVVIVCLLSFAFFAALGTAVTVVIAARALLPIAAKGFAGLLTGIAESAQAVNEVLHHGDSGQRLMLMTQLKESLDLSNQRNIDPGLAEWLRPGLEACSKDNDPKVVALAQELLSLLAVPQ